jgi:hypothetical protein
MTLPRFDAIVASWEKVPPLSVSAATIAAQLGAKREKKGGKAANDEQNPQQLFEMLGGAAGFSMEKPEWLRATTL